MASNRVERRLSAILAGDVAGYSRLMGADEEGTLAQLNAHRREFLEPKISDHRGRIVKRTGDGVLIEFASAVDAARCAIEIQRGMNERNAAVPLDKRIELRIGMNVGDIIIENDDIFGDGVNVAARLEGLANPGGICISDDTYRQVRDRLEATFDDIGEQNLKNISRPVRVYRLDLATKPAIATEAASPVLGLPDKPSIAVLPFQNMSGDPEQDYFADGMVDDIITGLSRIKWLFVIARNSTFTYKGRPIDVKQAGRDLGVRYVLEGSVRKAGNRVRILSTLQRELMSGPSATTVNLTIFSRCRTRSRSRWSVPSSQPCVLPKPNVSSANGQTVSTPMTWCCKPSRTSIRECRSHHRERSCCSTARSRLIQPIRWPMPSPRNVIMQFSTAEACRQNTGPPRFATRRLQSHTGRTMHWLLVLQDLLSPWTSAIEPQPLRRSMRRSPSAPR
jgi:class 3 adenylate cyclase